MDEQFSADFDLADGRKARVHWVNGPPYLSICYFSFETVTCEKCKGSGLIDITGKGVAGITDCPCCKGAGTVKKRHMSDK